MSRPILEVRGLMMRFGGLLAVNEVGLKVHDKQVVSMIGPNGAGKTTVFNCLTGFYQPTAGEILLDGTPIHGLPGHKIARQGVVRTFQNVRLFKDMTAVENLLVAQHRHLNTNFLAGRLKTPAFRQSELKALIAMLRDEHGVTVLLIEHDMKLVMSISDHIYVINQGTPLANGTPEQVRNNPDVIKAYLGEA